MTAPQKRALIATARRGFEARSPPYPWWQSAVIYQIYPRSFADSNGDGVGDIEGICSRIDYIADLGVDAIWLSPIYESPMADGGYDVSDHTAVDPLFGDLQTFDRLLVAAHRRGLRVLLDWVPNHTSSLHPWFLDSRSSRDSPKRDWYLWRDGSGKEPPNNWRSAFGGSAWTWDGATSQWYLHLFLPEQPDLNWFNPEVVDAMHGILRFWLDRGVDGFRADVVHLIGRDEEIPHHPAGREDLDIVGSHDHPRTHLLLRDIRRLLGEYDGDRVMIGEVPLAPATLLAPYYGSSDELHMVFDFALMHVPWSAEAFTRVIAEAEDALPSPDHWPCWVLSNHDQPRHRSRFRGSDDRVSEGRARAAAVVLLTLRGTPCLYAGEELGLLDAVVPEPARIDPNGRDGSRAPIPWKVAPGHGWPGRTPLPLPPEPARRNAEALAAEPDSILALYRRLLTARHSSQALSLGECRLLDSPAGTLVYDRRLDDEVVRVAVNFTDEPTGDVAVGDGWQIGLATELEREGTSWNARLGPSEAVVLTRR